MNIGKKVKDFVADEWEKTKDGVMRTALKAKFIQHPDLKTKLLETGTRSIGEASARDKYWAIGTSADTAKAKTVNAYHGFSNLSGSTPPGYACITGGLFNDTTAITSITLTAPNNFATLSRFSLYGIKG
jgi:hypothetical protein